MTSLKRATSLHRHTIQFSRTEPVLLRELTLGTAPVFPPCGGRFRDPPSVSGRRNLFADLRLVNILFSKVRFFSKRAEIAAFYVCTRRSGPSRA
jgi:hypothetical protein